MQFIKNYLEKQKVPDANGDAYLIFVKDYLNRNNMPDPEGDAGLIWYNHSNVSKAMSLIFYSILESQINESSIRDFHPPTGNMRPTFSVRSYIEDRFLKFTAYNGGIIGMTKVSRAVILGVLMYLDEIQRENADEKTGTLFMEWSNIHRLFLSAFVISAKFWEDGCYPNRYMARVGGVDAPRYIGDLDAPHLKCLEACFLKRIHFNLSFSDTRIKVYADLFEYILKKIPNLEWDYGDTHTVSPVANPGSYGIS
jgi:hypothetical protein